MGLNSEGRLVGQVRFSSVYDADGTYDGTADMLDMKGWDGCLVLALPADVLPSVGTNFLTGFKIVSNNTAAGGGTDTEIAEAVTTDGGTTKTLTAANMGTAAVASLGNDVLALDIKAEEMPQGDRYIAAVTAKSGTFPVRIVYIQYNGDHVFSNVIQPTRTAFQFYGDT